MNIFHRALFALLFFALTVQGFSQDANAPKTEKKTESGTKEQPRSEGLRKIASRHDFDFDINIDHEAIESAVENAMKSVAVTLENLDIRIEPIDINMKTLNMDFDPIEIHIPPINIDPINVDLHNLHLDMDHHFDWDGDNVHEDESMDQDNNKVEDKSNRKDNERSKGLKKLN